MHESVNGEELMCCVNKNIPMNSHLNVMCKSSHVGTCALHTNFALRLEDDEQKREQDPFRTYYFPNFQKNFHFLN